MSNEKIEIEDNREAITDEDTVIEGDMEFSKIIDMADFQELVTGLQSGVKSLKSSLEEAEAEAREHEEDPFEILDHMISIGKEKLQGMEDQLSTMFDIYLGVGAETVSRSDQDFAPKDDVTHPAWGLSDERDDLARLTPAYNPIAQASVVLTGLSKIATELDQKSLTKEADILDEIIENLARRGS